jgi:hypothetical protein
MAQLKKLFLSVLLLVTYSEVSAMMRLRQPAKEITRFAHCFNTTESRSAARQFSWFKRTAKTQLSYDQKIMRWTKRLVGFNVASVIGLLGFEYYAKKQGLFNNNPTNLIFEVSDSSMLFMKYPHFSLYMEKKIKEKGLDSKKTYIHVVDENENDLHVPFMSYKSKNAFAFEPNFIDKKLLILPGYYVEKVERYLKEGFDKLEWECSLPKRHYRKSLDRMLEVPLDEIESAMIKDFNQNSEDLFLRGFSGTIGHELHHLKHSDASIVKNFIINQCFYIPTIALLPACIRSAAKVAPSITKVPAFALFLGSAILEYKMSVRFGMTGVIKYKEYRADINASQNPDVLRSLGENIKFLEIEKIPAPPSWCNNPYLRELWYFFVSNDVHPHRLTRAEYLEKRAQELEKQQKDLEKID